MKTKTIGIVGGLGPEATVDIFQKIIRLSPAKTDKKHLRILIDNNPKVPSRIKAVLENGKSPLASLIKMAQGLENLGADFLIMPCITADFYTPQIRKQINIPFLSIIDETADYIFNIKPRIKKVGLLATEATMRMGTFHQALIEKKFEIVHQKNHSEILKQIIPTIRKSYYHLMAIDVDNDLHDLQVTKTLFAQEVSRKVDFSIAIPKLSTMRKKVMKAIFGQHGIKAGHYSQPHQLLKSAANELKKEGAQAIILGCTEIPLVLKDKDVTGVKLVDPMKVLAQKAVDLAYNKNVYTRKTK